MERKKEQKMRWIIFVTLFFVWLFMHYYCKILMDDAVWYLERKPVLSTWPLIWEHYVAHMKQWSSRFVIDLVGRFFELNRMLYWKVVDTFFWVFLVYHLDAIFNEEKSIRKTLFISCSAFFVDFLSMSAGGWMAATFTYFWPVVLGIYCLKILNKLYQQAPVKWFEYIVDFLCFIYAIDNQQIVAIAVVLLTYYMIMMYRKRDLKGYVVFLWCICVARLGVHLFWQGSNNRMSAEIISWFPEWGTMNLIDKLQMGFTSSLAVLFGSFNLVTFALYLALSVAVFQKTRNVYIRVISSIPTIVVALAGPLRSSGEKFFPHIYKIMFPSIGKYGLINELNYSDDMQYIVLFIWTVCLLILVFSIFYLYDTIYQKFLYCLILLCGIGSRVILGFSPTVSASGERTYICLYITVWVLMLGVCMNFDKKYKGLQILENIYSVSGIVAAFNTLIAVYYLS